MKVISLHEPWATLIKAGAKKIETRSWKTNYRGEIYIHASKTTNKDFLNDKLVRKYIKDVPLGNGYIIAKATLTDCTIMTEELIEEIKETGDEFHFGIYGLGRFAWQLENIEVLTEPIKVNGKLGIWDLEI